MRTNEEFPVLPGLMWNRKRTPIFKTSVQQAINGKEYRIPHQDYPLWRWELSYEVLRDDATNELRTLVGMFLRHRGSFASFRFLDVDDYQTTAQSIAASASRAAGTRVQLLRSYEGFLEPVTDPQPGYQVFVNGVLSGLWTALFPTGEISNTATSNGALSWTGSFWHRVRFEEDETEFEQFLEKLHSARRVTLVSAR